NQKANLTDGTEYKVTAKVVDKAGNESAASEEKKFTVDLTDPTAPTVDAKTDGSVEVTLPEDADKVVVTYTPTDSSNGETKTVTLTKDENGTWTSDDASITPVDGKITLPADKVKDETGVKAVATDKAGNDAEGSAIAKQDPVSVEITVDTSVPEDLETTEAGGVNNGTAGDSKASGKLKAMEGSSEVSLVAQTKESIYGTFTLNANGTWTYVLDDSKPATQALQEGQAVTDSFDVTSVKGGSYTISVTVNGKDDAAVIGGVKTGSVTDGVGANNDVSATNTATGKLTVTDVDNDPTWTAASGDATYGAYSINAEGNWTYTLDQSNEKVNQLKQGDTLTDTFEVATSGGDKETVTVTINGQNAKLASISLNDNFTDDFENGTTPHNPQQQSDSVTQYYPNQSADNYTGNITSGSGSTAVSKATGLTNDATPTLSFSLDKALDSNQELVVVRYKLGTEISNFEEYDETVIENTSLQTTDGINYTFTDNLEETRGQDYLYRVKVVDTVDGEEVVTSTQEFKFRLDTIVEPMRVKSFNSDTTQMVLEPSGGSEMNATITFRYMTGTGEFSQWTTVRQDSDGTYTFNMPNWNRYTNDGIEVRIVDGAGNVTTSKIYAMRNLFSALNESEGPDTTASTNRVFGGGFDDPTYVAYRQTTATHENGGITSSDGNDYIILGLEQFGGFNEDGTSKNPLTNGSLAKNDLDKGSSPRIDMGAGDDYLLVRGTLQQMNGLTIAMGEGNDKLELGGSIIGTQVIDMGDGDNLISVTNSQLAATYVTYKFGDGNDLLTVGGNLDGESTIELGNGNNEVRVGGYIVDKNVITGGDGDDRIEVSKQIGGNSPYSGDNTINLGGGDNSIFTGTYLDDSKITMEDGNNSIVATTSISDTTMTLGNGNNRITSGTYMQDVNITAGNGDNTILVKTTMDDTNITLGDGNNAITTSNHLNDSTIIMGNGDNSVTTGAEIGGTTLTTGSGSDTFNFDSIANASVINTGAGDDTIMVTQYIYKNALYTGNSPTINMGDGDDKLIVGNNSNIDAYISNETSIDMGNGNDIIEVTGSIGLGTDRFTVQLGAGDDKITIGGDVGQNVTIDGGDGLDTLVITSSSKVDNIKQFINFEVIDLTGASNYHLDLALSQLTLNNPDGKKALYIQGNASSTIDFGDNGSAATGSNGSRTTTTEPAARYTDGNGYWSKVGTVEKDGVTYDTYAYNGTTGSTTENLVHIEQGITII
ncbi:VCBS domain-containing protein, partial [Volucribacter psittacicida]|uniref:VCBS domain-containing protein n=1 Tax=Volucribacter psittacicida TaxID=203482 RepID=UPI001A9F2002